MKRTLTIMLILIFFYNTIGFLLIHPLITYYYKRVGLQEAANHSTDKLVELIILRKEDIFLGKINFERIQRREFRLNGKMYDIVREIHEDSLIYFYCFNDIKEESLTKEFNNRITDNSASIPIAQTNKKQRTSDNNPLKKIITEPVCYSIFEKANTSYSTYKLTNAKNYLSIREDVATPPPQSFYS